MALDTLTLPDKPLALCQVIDRHCVRYDALLQYRRVSWLLAYYYLQGARRFDIFDPSTGKILPYYVDKEGNLEFQSQELLSKINKVVARLSQIDVRPRIVAEGASLDSIRQRSVTQLVMDACVGADQSAEVQRLFNYTYACLGSCGVIGHAFDHPTIGLTTDIEVVHPREMVPFPSLGPDLTRKRGLVRQRTVALTFLEEKFGKAKLTANRDDLEWWKVSVGEPLAGGEDDNLGTGYYSTSRALSYRGVPDDDNTTMAVAKIRELWLDGPRGTCSRYVVTCGEVLLMDVDLSGQEVYCPLGFARFYENGTFHGAGMFDLLFPIARQLELNLKQLFNNVRDIDRYGVLVMPSGQWNQKAQLRDIGRGLRVLDWMPDPALEGFKPFPIQPFNAGDMPGRVAQLSKNMMDGLSPDQDLAAEKGRVDSFSGLQFLDEQMNRGMTLPSQGVEQAWGAMYRGVATQLTMALVTSPRALPVGKLSIDLAGAVIDPDKNTVSFRDNPVPDTSRLTFTIKETNPKSQATRKAEALELVKEGVNDPDNLKILSLDEGLDFAIWDMESRAPYEVVVRNVLLLYGDGQTPGQLILTPYTSNPQLQLRILNAFMSSMTMAVASVDVTNAFRAYRETLMMWMGTVLPQGAPNPDDAAILGSMGRGQLPASPMMQGQPPGQMPQFQLAGA